MPEYRKFPEHHDAAVRDVNVRVILNRTVRGKLNTNGQFSLTANATETTVSDILIDSTSVFSLMPMTANAASAVSSLYLSTLGNGYAVWAHASSSASDKVFRYSVIG